MVESRLLVRFPERFALCAIAVFIYSHFNMDRQTNVPNGVHIAVKKTSPNMCPIIIIKQSQLYLEIQKKKVTEGNKFLLEIRELEGSFLTWWTDEVWPQCCDASCTSWSELIRYLWLPLEKQTRVLLWSIKSPTKFTTKTSFYCSTKTQITKLWSIFTLQLSVCCVM